MEALSLASLSHFVHDGIDLSPNLSKFVTTGLPDDEFAECVAPLVGTIPAVRVRRGFAAMMSV